MDNEWKEKKQGTRVEVGATLLSLDLLERVGINLEFTIFFGPGDDALMASRGWASKLIDLWRDLGVDLILLVEFLTVFLQFGVERSLFLVVDNFAGENAGFFFPDKAESPIVAP